MHNIIEQKCVTTSENHECISKINDTLKDWNIRVIKHTRWFIYCYCFVVLLFFSRTKVYGVGVMQKLLLISGISSILFLSYYKTKISFDDELVKKVRFYTFLIVTCWSSVMFYLLLKNIVVALLAIVVPLIIKIRAEKKHFYLFRTIIFQFLTYLFSNIKNYAREDSILFLVSFLIIPMLILDTEKCKASLYKENILEEPNFETRKGFLLKEHKVLIFLLIAESIVKNKSNIYLTFPWALVLSSLLIEEQLSYFLTEKYKLINNIINNGGCENATR